jgi:2-haloalkanoic acid dehalogenase type II
MGIFDRYQTLSFDCYGTLIDWEAGLTKELAPFATRIGQDARALLSQFGELETKVQIEFPTLRYPEILAETLRRIGRQQGFTVSDEEATGFGASVPDWPAFSDSAQGLADLKKRFQLVILSNIDRASFAASNRKLGVEFDLVVTAEDVGSYKPDPANFEAMFARLAEIGSSKQSLLHVAQSLFHDHVPAQALGLETVWIDRQGKPGGATPPPSHTVVPTWTFPSLAAFASAAAS